MPSGCPGRPKVEVDVVTEPAAPSEAGGLPDPSRDFVERGVELNVERGAQGVRALAGRGGRVASRLSGSLRTVGASRLLEAGVEPRLLRGITARARERHLEAHAREQREEALRDRRHARVERSKCAGHYFVFVRWRQSQPTPNETSASTVSQSCCGTSGGPGGSALVMTRGTHPTTC